MTDRNIDPYGMYPGADIIIITDELAALRAELATAANVARALGEERERAQLAATEAEIRAEMAEAQLRANYNATADALVWARMFGEVLPPPTREVSALVDALVVGRERMTKAEALNVALVAALERITAAYAKVTGRAKSPFLNQAYAALRLVREAK